MKESTKRVVSPDALFSDYASLLETVDKDVVLPVIISGNSMAPFLKHGRDKVFLSRIIDTPKRGDIILFRRRSGTYVLHRVYKIKNGTMTMLGDAQTALESNIPLQNAIAIVNCVIRNGKKLTDSSTTWKFFETVWLALRPFRPLIFKIHAFFKRKSKQND